MSIIYDEKSKLFYLHTNKTSYIMQIYDAGYLSHVYWGKRIKNFSITNKDIGEEVVNLDAVLQEYSAYGTGDFRTPSYEIQLENGSTTGELKYLNHRIFSGKRPLEGLPSTYVESENEADTLEIVLEDTISRLEIVLSYAVFENYNVITRNAKLINKSNKEFKIKRALSFNVDFNNSNYDVLQLSGAWARERHIYRRALIPGIQSIDSKRGISSHQQNPFIALLSKDANEDFGDVYAFNLAYSGSFLAQVEVDQFFTTRVQMGINPFDFEWNLEPGQSFQTPEAIMVYSSNGLGEMSRTYHKLYRERLCKGAYRDKERPILINNWEATYFNFDAKKIEEIASIGKELGMELFVLDDGWFGKRDSDNCSLGDWVVDLKKLPEGLDNLVENITKKGIRFGLWFEPEMVSPDSDLYRAHPDWCIHVPNRTPAQWKYQRNQLVLDLTRKEVCDKIIEMVSNILSSTPISYVKWDMNRSLTDIGSAVLPSKNQRETVHRYVLGLYYILEEVTSKFPNILFESCSSGGGRFDPGMLYYMPQTWASDDSDAVERLKIQYGTTMAYPPVSIGAHVSASPNHQIGREAGFDIRGNVAMGGTFGYELDLTKLTEEEKETVKKQIEYFKDIRHITQFGDFYRILSPFEGNETAWMFVTEDKKEAMVFYFKVLAEPFGVSKKLKLKGLNEKTTYQIDGRDIIVGGDELMYSGINVENTFGDFTTYSWRLKEVE
ncbi:MAG: alpha-galactosidase [Epulopiscium sp.]|nr:alpha-galactosidase [Candidatus Epulonipiscium sp.]